MKKWDKADYRLLMWVIIGSALLFLPGLGRVHLFDWDEINFAEAAREMLVTGNWSQVQINYQPFWEKPPFFFWLQAISMQLAGIGEYAARLPNALCGIFVLSLLYILGRHLRDNRFGMLWAMAYVGSFLPHLYFKSGIIDPVFNTLLFLALVFFFHAGYHQGFRKTGRVIAAGILAGLAVLTKGQAGLILLVITAVASLTLLREWNRYSIINGIIALFLAILVAGAWFGYDIAKNGTWFIEEFIRYQIRLVTTEDAGHGGPFYYHFIVLLIGCFPASVFMFRGLGALKTGNGVHYRFSIWMICLLITVLVVFSIVHTKIIHYSSLAYFPLTYFAALGIDNAIRGKTRHGVAEVVLVSVTGFLLAIALAAVPFAGNHTGLFMPYIKDPFARACLQAEVDWPVVYSLSGIVLFAGITGYTIYMKKDVLRGSAILFAASVISIQLMLYGYIPRIEKYTQGAAIAFYKTLQNRDVYVEVLGFKSYAHLFYTRKQPPVNPESLNKQWLLYGEIDKPAYFVTKNVKKDQYTDIPGLKMIEEKNGYVFFERLP